MTKRDDTIFWAIIACLLWSTAYAGIKIGLQYDTPLHFAGIRFIISGLMILPFTVKPVLFISIVREHWRIVFWVTFLQTLVNYIFFYLGLDLVPGALGAVIVGSQPLVTAVVAAIMNKAEHLTRRKIITIVFGISGVILISAGRQAFKLGTAAELAGVFMILVANIGTSTSNVMVSLRSKGINPFVLSSSSLLTGGIIIYLLSLTFEVRPQGPKPGEYWISLAWLSFMSAFTFSLWYKLLQRPHVKVSELNLWKFLIPVVGAILSWILVPGENPEWLTIAGMVIITTALILFYKNGKKIPSA
ncbi:MAG: EamA family transporter [Bacteroidota bacterium]|nr:EamA family transporter [Bacteroidota bacterium]